MIIVHEPFESHKKKVEYVGKDDSLQHIFPFEVISVCCEEEELYKAYRILGRKPCGRKEMVFMGVNAQEIVANW
jgi:hypothetical protein